eukprot:CAMPEP_0119329918 /NCGR_PEP_ID=MMETSP1333-20130426/77014_1 /TAXON_ID=418940 /ORGANISM="Scyphosphaera apsteinii, Strain RCC1455" /LENGTH=161 /DNA_ID=CAMNT_0007339163 /DNA_START=192 /DNA_END=677 /DNA_ORIENTATION=+
MPAAPPKNLKAEITKMYEAYCGDKGSPRYNLIVCVARRIVEDPEAHNDKKMRRRYKQLTNSTEYKDGFNDMLTQYCRRHSEARGDYGIHRQPTLGNLHKIPQSRVCDEWRSFKINTELQEEERRTGINRRKHKKNFAYRKTIPDLTKPSGLSSTIEVVGYD